MDAHDDDMPSDFEAHDSPLLACRFPLYSLHARNAFYVMAGWIRHYFETFGLRHGTMLLPTISIVEGQVEKPTARVYKSLRHFPFT